MSTLELGTLQAEPGALAPPGAVGNYTLIQITGQYSVAGQPGQGTVTFTLTQPLTNNGVLVPANPLIAQLDAQGNLQATLLATDDAGTTPAGAWYGVTEQITGAQPRDYFIQVLATGPNPLALQPPGDIAWR